MQLLIVVIVGFQDRISFSYFLPKNYDYNGFDIKIGSIYNILRYVDVYRGDEKGVNVDSKGAGFFIIISHLIILPQNN